MHDFGRLLPGEAYEKMSPGTFTIIGDYVQHEEGVIVFDRDYWWWDTLIVDGNAVLEGGIQFVLGDNLNYLPVIGEEFALVYATESIVDRLDPVIYGRWGYEFSHSVGFNAVTNMFELRIRVETVPTPSAVCMVLVCGGGIMSRRRR